MARAGASLVGPMTLLLVACGGNSFSTVEDGTGGGNTGGTSTGGGSTGGASVGGGSTGGASTGGVGGGSTGGSTSVYAADFDQSCAYDGECLPVHDGNVCGCQGCPSSAINSAEADRFRAAVLAVSCPETDQLCLLAGCLESVGTCNGGTCGVRPAVVVSEGQFDATCDADEACRVIPAGEVCADCQCSFIAVSADGYQQYREIVSGIECHHGGAECLCPAPLGAYCKKSGMAGSLGTCTTGQ